MRACCAVNRSEHQALTSFRPCRRLAHAGTCHGATRGGAAPIRRRIKPCSLWPLAAGQSHMAAAFTSPQHKGVHARLRRAMRGAVERAKRARVRGPLSASLSLWRRPLIPTFSPLAGRRSITAADEGSAAFVNPRANHGGACAKSRALRSWRVRSTMSRACRYDRCSRCASCERIGRRGRTHGQ